MTTPRTAAQYIDLVRRMSVRGGFTFWNVKLDASEVSVRGQPAVRVLVKLDVPDRAHTSATAGFRFELVETIEVLNRDPEPFELTVLQFLVVIIEHEVRESVFLDDKLVSDPHAAGSGDPFGMAYPSELPVERTAAEAKRRTDAIASGLHISTEAAAELNRRTGEPYAQYTAPNDAGVSPALERGSRSQQAETYTPPHRQGEGHGHDDRRERRPQEPVA